MNQAITGLIDYYRGLVEAVLSHEPTNLIALELVGRLADINDTTAVSQLRVLESFEDYLIKKGGK